MGLLYSTRTAKRFSSTWHKQSQIERASLLNLSIVAEFGAGHEIRTRDFNLRRNYIGARTERGMKVAGIFYSVFESARTCGVDPEVYLS